jgi:copper chaperone CopZ
MKDIQFKTNIKCMGCINTVKPHLDALEHLQSWEVDLSTPDRVLSAKLDDETSPDAILQALEKAGYTATELTVD